MDLTLTRILVREDGIFSHINETVSGKFVCMSVTHDFDGHTIIPHGVYTCIRGIHKLHEDSPEFETFEVMGIEGHDGLLFHIGNFGKDSRGCECVGKEMIEAPDGEEMVMHSADAFAKFMQLQVGLDQFQLKVEGIDAT